MSYCKVCSDGPGYASTGYIWDTYNACPACDKGKAIQYEDNKHELKRANANAKSLRKLIKDYEQVKGDEE